MKIRFINNSVSGVSRQYRGFSFELQGYREKTLDVPSQYVADLKKYLKSRHPAVRVIEEVTKQDVAAENTDQQGDTEVTEIVETNDNTLETGEGEEDVAAENTGKKNNKKSGGKK
jgi:hypothetical protein